MTPTVTAALTAAGALAYLTLLGYGPALAWLPPRLRPWFWLATPLVGLTVAAIGLGWLTLVLPGGVAGAVLLAATLAWAAWRTLRGDRPPSGQRWREQAMAAAAVAVAAGLALAPLAGLPDLIAIGRNWDIEIYLPMAAYLQNAPLGFGLADPAGFPFPGLPNPLLWRVNFFDPRWSGLTFQELHAALDALGGLAPHQSFTGLLAALFALTPAAVFLLVRAGFGAGLPASAAAALLTAAGAPGLFVVYWSFGQQASALPLLPLGLLACLLAVRNADRGSLLLAGAVAAALAGSYMPAVPVYAAGAACVLAAEALAGRNWRTAGMTALTVIGGVLVLAPWAVIRSAVRAWHFFDERGVAGLTVGPDVSDFPPLGWAFGLYPSPESGLAGLFPKDGGPEGLRFVLLAVIVAGAVAAWRRREYGVALLALAPALVLLPLRYAAPYPYGYLKSAPFVAPLLLGLLVLGLERLWEVRVRWLSGWRTVLAVGAAGLLAVNLASAVQAAAQAHADSPMAFRAVEGLTAAVPQGASVFVSGHRDQWGPRDGAVAYALRHASLYGYLATGFSTFYRERDDGAYDYALFSAGERPWSEVFPAGVEPAWSGMGLDLYRAPAGLRAYLDQSAGAPPVVERTGGRGAAAGQRITEWTAEGYPAFSGWSPPLLGVLAETTPLQVRYPAAIRGADVDVDLPPEAAGKPPRYGQLTVASFRPQTVTVKVDSRRVELNVPAGLSSHSLGALAGATQVTVLDNGNQSPLWVRSLSLWAGEPSGGRHQGAVLVSRNARLAESGVAVDVAYWGPSAQQVIDIYSADGAVHYGYWVVGPPDRGGFRFFRLRLDTEHQQLVPLMRPGGAPFESFRGEAPDGDYRMYLFVWKDGRVLQQAPVCSFTLRGKRAVSVTAEPGDLFIG